MTSCKFRTKFKDSKRIKETHKKTFTMTLIATEAEWEKWKEREWLVLAKKGKF